MVEKISPELKAELEKLRLARIPKKIRVLVEFVRRPTVQALQSVRVRFMAEIVYQSRFTPYVSIEVDISQVEKIAALPSVKKVWHIQKYYPLKWTPLDEGEPWSHHSLLESARHLNIDVVKAAGYTGKNVVVAVIGTGVDKTHPMLQDKIIAERSFIPTEPDPTDVLNHDTHCASTIAGRYWVDPVSGMELEGMAPDAMLTNAKVLSHSGNADTIMAGIEWACTQTPTPKIASCSWGATGYIYEPMRILIETMMDTYGTIFVFAAGNDGPELGSIAYPAGDPRTVGVGSIAIHTSRPNYIAPFSARGPSAYTDAAGKKLIKPDIMAPGGVDVKTGTDPEEIICAAGIGGTRMCNRGTSFATPHIAGGLALLIEAGVPNPVDRLYSTARDLVDIGKDNDTGFGVADFAKALGLPLPNSHVLTVETPISGVKFYVNGWVLESPWSEELREGIYKITVPKIVFVNSYVYEFTQWKDGETSLIRTINLTTDMTLKASYKRLNAYVNVGAESRRVGAGSPDWNPGPRFPSAIITMALTTSGGETLPTRSFVKFNLANLPEGLQITSAKLYLRCYDLDLPRDIEVYAVEDDGWSEDTITWNNKPPLGSLLSTSHIDLKDAVYEWDITPFVKSEYLGDKLVSLCVKDTNEETTPGYDFIAWFEGVKAPPPPAGKNSPPYIIITYEAVGKGILEVHAYATKPLSLKSKKEKIV